MLKYVLLKDNGEVYPQQYSFHTLKAISKYVRDTLVKTYHMNEIEAARAVRDSYLSKALANDKDFVEHDTVEEWAEFIHDEINSEELLMM